MSLPDAAWCFLVGGDSTFSVNIDEIRTRTVHHLKVAIKAKVGYSAPAYDLTLYRVAIDESHDDQKRITELQQISQNLKECTELDEVQQLSKNFGEIPSQGKAYYILVRTPKNEHDKDFRPQVTFKVQSPGNWDDPDLENNKIRMLPVTGIKPQYIETFKKELTRRRLVTDINAEALNRLRPHLPIEDYFDVKSRMDIDASNLTSVSDALREVTSDELSHYYTNFLNLISQDIATFRHQKEPYLHAVLDYLSSHVRRIYKSERACLKFNDLGGPLIADFYGEKAQYAQESDASLRINNFTHLILKVNSDEAQSDRIQLLLQAACLARLGSVVRQDPARPFIVSAISIDDILCAKWYFVYQPSASDAAVEYAVDLFDLTDAKRAFDFAFRLYNFVSLATEDNNNLRDPWNSVAKLHSDVTQMKLPSFPALIQKYKTRDSGDRDIPSDVARDDDHDILIEATRRDPGDDILSDETILEAMERAGYSILSLPEGWKSLLPLTAKTLEAESVHGESVILKLTDQHEVKVLQCLHGNQTTKKTRIIPLLDVVDGRLMVLPQRTPLKEFLIFDASDADIGVLAVQFLEGVAYLQHCSVAHLDLKPDNIVVQRDRKSKAIDVALIDFDIAAFADLEPTIEGACGTRGWCAPEVFAGKPYDPLLADRWSCGRVLRFFTERMKPSRLQKTLRSLSQRLMDPDPSLRPPVPDHL